MWVCGCGDAGMCGGEHRVGEGSGMGGYCIGVPSARRKREDEGEEEADGGKKSKIGEGEDRAEGARRWRAARGRTREEASS